MPLEIVMSTSNTKNTSDNSDVIAVLMRMLIVAELLIRPNPDSETAAPGPEVSLVAKLRGTLQNSLDYQADV